MNPYALVIEALPRWYSLSFDTGKAAIVARTHPAAFLAIIRELWEDTHRLKSYREGFGFASFAPPSDLYGWGFSMKQAGTCGERLTVDASGWRVWRFPLPRMGLGGREQADWDSAYAFSATLDLFFSALDGCVRDLEPGAFAGGKQLLRIAMSVDARKACYGAPISAQLSAEAVRLLPQAMSEVALRDIEGAMRTACEMLWGDALEDEAGRFMAKFDPPEDLHFHMPLGNAVGLDSAWTGRIPGHGHDLQPHNTDTPYQQLTMLAALARLHEHLERVP